MAVALYRRYRPVTFAEMIGQEHVTEPLSQALRAGRLHHAYLFSGPRGCGKTTSARILARSLNCVAGPTPQPCGECDSCRAMAKDGSGSVDVVEIDAASHGGVDDARDLRERAFFTPVAGRFKIYIIDEAHMVSAAGFNALLKLVEEPPDYVMFVFATTEPEKVLPTIKSRTHHYPFRLVPPGVLRSYLEQLCAAEQIAVEPAVFPLVVRAGGGSVRDSLSVLDQLIAGAGPDGIGYAQAVALLGVTDAALLEDVCAALAAGDGAAAFATVDRVIEAGHDPRRFAADLLERLRDLLVLQQVPDAVDKGLLDVPADQLERMSTQASQLGVATLTRCAEIIHNGLLEMRGTTSPRLLLELICARMLLPGVDGSAGGLLQRLERLERRLTATGGGAAIFGGDPPGGGTEPAAQEAAAQEAAAQKAAAQEAAAQEAAAQEAAAQEAVAAPGENAAPAETSPAPAPAPPASGAAPGALDAAAIRRVWDEVVTTVGRRSKRAAAVAREAAVRAVEGDTVVLLFQHGVHANMLAATPQPVIDALREVLGGDWQVRCETRDAGEQPDPPPPSPPPARAAAAAAAPSPASPAPPASPSEAAEAADGDWPEPAQPGGKAGAAPASPAARTPTSPDRTAPQPTGPDPQAPPHSGEQQALDLLRRTLGAEKIGEVAT